MGPETRLARLVRATAQGTLVGLICAAADFMCAPVAAHATPLNINFVLGLSLLVALGSAAGLTSLLPKHLILLLLAGTGYWLGTELTRGAYAQTLPLSSLWKFILAAAVPAAATWIDSHRGRRSTTLAVTIALAITLAIAFVERGHYTGIRAALLPIVIAACLFGTLPWSRKLPHRILASVGVVSALYATILAIPSQPIVDATESRASLNVAPMLMLRSLLPHNTLNRDDIDLVDAPFYGTAVAEESRDRFKDVNGVLLITIDALRPDLPGQSIGGRKVTPTLDQLQRMGMTFSRNYATCTSSHLSLLSLFSGALPAAIDSQAKTGKNLTLITERLTAQEIETRSCFPLAVHTVRNHDRPFTQEDLGFAHATRHELDDPSDAAIINAISPSAGGQFFSYCHIMRPHKPYGDADARFHAGDSQFERYAADVRSADSTLDAILTAFEAKGLLSKTLVIITADHGEEFGEHGGATHGSHLFDETARVPMIVVGPGVAPGTRYKGITSTVDIALTLEHLFCAPTPRMHRAGRSLLPLLAGLQDTGRSNRAFGEILPILSFAAESLTMVVEGRWKLLIDQATNRTYLFDLEADPMEKRNVYNNNPKVASRLAGLITARREADDSTASAVRDARVDMVKELESRALSDTLLLFTTEIEQISRILPFSLSYLAADLTDAQARSVCRVVNQNDQKNPSVRAALLCVRIGAGLSTDAELKEALNLIESENNPFIQIAAYRSLSRAGIPDLIDRQLPTPAAHADVVELARMTYRATLGKKTPRRTTVRGALNHKNPWIRRLAIECAVATGDARYLEDLQRSSVFFSEVRYRAALDAAYDVLKKDR